MIQPRDFSWFLVEKGCSHLPSKWAEHTTNDKALLVDVFHWEQ